MHILQNIRRELKFRQFINSMIKSKNSEKHELKNKILSKI